MPKIILITGASSGIGRACAERFAEAGYDLILTGRRRERLETLTQTLTKKFQIKTHVLVFDIQNQVSTQEAINNLPENWQAIDVLINNAGLALGIEKIQDGLLENWEQMIDTNIKGLLYITHAILPLMLQRNKGHVVNIGSIAGHEHYPGGNVYSATKHAVKALSYNMRLDLQGTAIRISSVDPGMVKTEFSKVRFKGDQQQAENVYQNMTPLNPEDIAECVYFCISRPSHVVIQDMLVMPQDQASATAIYRHKDLPES